MDLSEKNSDERLEAIKQDLMTRAAQAKKTAEGMRQFGDCGISFSGLATVYEHILLEHFGEKCDKCKKKKILYCTTTKGRLCEECFYVEQSKERYKAGLK
jgi:hypothetical protein